MTLVLLTARADKTERRHRAGVVGCALARVDEPLGAADRRRRSGGCSAPCGPNLGSGGPGRVPAARLLRYGEHASTLSNDLTPSVEMAWGERVTYGLHEVPGRGHLATQVWLPDATADRELQLSSYFLDPGGSSAVSDDLELGPEWGADEGWRVAQDRALTLMSDGTAIGLVPFDALSRLAVSALAVALARTSANH